jgi:ribonuclease Z
LNKLGIIKFLPVPVIHCPQSYGIVVEHMSNIKISYSGDTRPAPEFAKAAKNSTILIHEATFGDDLADNALSHYHSTVGEAIDMYFYILFQRNEGRKLENSVNALQSTL